MTKRKFIVSYDDFVTCLDSGAISCAAFSAPLAAQIRDTSLGAFVVALKGYETNIAKKMYLVMWRCRGDNVNCLVNKSEMGGFESKLKAIPRSKEEVAVEKAVVEEVVVAVEAAAAVPAATIGDRCTLQ